MRTKKFVLIEFDDDDSLKVTVCNGNYTVEHKHKDKTISFEEVNNQIEAFYESNN